MFSLIKNNDNNKKLFLVRKKLSNINNDFIEMLKRLEIENINLTSFGNSIATGYAMNDDIYPMLKRNDDLFNKLEEHNISVRIHSFARAQDNNDEHLLDWIINNKKESEINKLVHEDFNKNNKNKMDIRGLKQEYLEELYPTKLENDIGLQDLIKQGTESEPNIIVYNGATGSFLDNITRHGKHLNLHGFYRDFKSMEATLKTIYLINPNTQVYVCGIPNLTKLNLVVFLNHEIKKICKNYPNCTYVKPVPQNFIYKKNGKIIIDIHYNNEEYLKLNGNIIETITKNYEKVKILVKIDKLLKQYNEELFKNGYSSKEQNTEITSKIIELIENNKEKLTKKQLKEIIKYYKEKYAYDYYYTPRKTVIETLKTK